VVDAAMNGLGPTNLFNQSGLAMIRIMLRRLAATPSP
jgi:hypothetical protein